MEMTILEKSIVKAYEALDSRPNCYIKGETVTAIAGLNNQNPRAAIEDAFAIGFIQGLEAAKAEYQRGGRTK